jgi:hypothetical protein
MARRTSTNPLPTPVAHPRYGYEPMDSGSRVSAEELAHSYWGYAHSTFIDRTGKVLRKGDDVGGTEYIFCASALPADVAKQKFGVFPRRHYVDILRRCRTCGEWFLFFAREQRHWYEVLGFWIDANCVHCHDCRLRDQRLRKARARYADRISSASTLGDRELLTLLRDALFLTESGLIKGDARLRRVRNLVKRRGIAAEQVHAVEAFLSKRPSHHGDEF